MVLAANGFQEHIARCYAEAERLDPADPAWPYLHGVHLLEVSPKQAFPLLKKALSLTGDREEQKAMHFRLARALLEAGQMEQADEHARALQQLEPHGVRSRFVSALLALERGEHDRARDHLSVLTDVPFAKKSASLLLAPLLDKDAAQALRERAARLPLDAPWFDPIEDRMRQCRGERLHRIEPYWALERQGKTDEALAFLRRFVATAPDREVCFILGQALMARAEFAEAEEMFRAAIAYEPTNVKSHLLLGACRLARAEQRHQEPGGREAAAALFRQAVAAEDDALALQPENGLAHQVRGWALKHLGRTDEAVASLRRAVLILPNDAESHWQLGETLAESGRLKEGLEHLRLAVEFARPGDQRPRQALEKWEAKSSKSSCKFGAAH
jgi:tetratricopeptide (TPR) repeat protein